MIKAGKKMTGGLNDATEEEVSKYIAALSPKQCVEIKRIWPDFEHTIKSAFSGALEECVLQLMEEPTEMMARELNEAMKGMGTNNKTLNRILAGNHKHVAMQISASFFKKYDKKLSDELKSETSGDFCQALLTWVAGNDASGGLESTVMYYRRKMFENMLSGADAPAYADILRAAIANCKDCVTSLDCDILKKATVGLGTDERAGESSYLLHELFADLFLDITED